MKILKLIFLMIIATFIFFGSQEYSINQEVKKEENEEVPEKVRIELIPIDRSITKVVYDLFEVPEAILSNDGLEIATFVNSFSNFVSTNIFFYFKNTGISGDFDFNIIVEESKHPIEQTEQKRYWVEKNKRYALAVTLIGFKARFSWKDSYSRQKYTVNWTTPERLIDKFSIELPAVGPPLIILKLYELTNDMQRIEIGLVTREAQWRFVTMGRVNTPVVAGDTVYIPSRDKNLYAVDTKTGKEKWRFMTDDFVGSPFVSGGVVYIGSLDHNLYAVDAETGKEKWRFVTGDKIRSRPVVAGDVVYIGSIDKNCYALDAESGKEKWRFVTGSAVLGHFVIGGFVYIGSGDKNLYTVDAETGKEKWRFATGRGVNTPVVAEDVVYIGSEDKNCYALDAESGKEKWRFVTKGFVSSPVVAGDTVYIPSRDKNLYAVDAENGKGKWRFVTGGRVNTPVVAEDVIYIPSDDNNLYVVDLKK